MSTAPQNDHQLAVLGGRPMFDEPLHVGRPNIGDRVGFLERVEQTLDRRWFTNDGPLVIELERRIAERLEVAHCVVVSNGTNALRLLLRAAGITGQVLMPSFTFIGTAHAVALEGLEPVFCDIDRDTWCLDVDACEASIGSSTGAILGVHLFGHPCEPDRFASLADRHRVDLLFDAAHAFGSSAGARPVGGFGHAEAFSFHATKAFHTFEGGAVATDDDDLAAEIRLARSFGFCSMDEVAGLGTNAKMPEVCAAMGLANLDHFDGIVSANRATFDTYSEHLASIPGLRLRTFDRQDAHNWHYVVTEVDEEAYGLCRDELLATLHAENVLARRYFFPGAHAMAPYRDRLPDAADRLPNTVEAAASVLVFPGGQAMTAESVERVCHVLEVAHARASHIRSELAATNDGRPRRN